MLIRKDREVDSHCTESACTQEVRVSRGGIGLQASYWARLRQFAPPHSGFPQSPVPPQPRS